MPNPPEWARLNRVTAWAGYICGLVFFVFLAFAVVAAATGHGGWAIVAGALCIIAGVVGIVLWSTVTRRDRLEHHNSPSLLQSTWEQSPAEARRRGEPDSIQPHRMDCSSAMSKDQVVIDIPVN